MATWTGEAWLGSASGRQKVSVQSNTFHGAKEQIQQIYGTDNVHNLREENDNEGGGFELGGGATVWIGGIILFIVALPYLIPIIVFGLIGWGVYKFVKWILK
tara:strand:- start:236 stop:541 length:306 start_codon:yes stop_codon:yes gene_type:complete